MQDFATFISRSSLFRGLPDADINTLAAICVEKNGERGEMILFEGTPAHGFYLVLKGQVKIFKSSAEGKEKILHVCAPGESFAEVPVFSAGRYPASASAIEATRLLCFPRESFREIIERQPSLALNMLANFAQKLRRFTSQVEQLSLREVPARIASHLLHLGETQKSPDRVMLRIPKGQLANLLGTTPETLSRVFSRMHETGVIRIQGREITILDSAELARLAG